MKIDQVRSNLITTIAGKEAYMAQLWDRIAAKEVDPQMTIIIIEFLKVNLGELRTILADVERCLEEPTIVH